MLILKPNMQIHWYFNHQENNTPTLESDQSYDSEQREVMEVRSWI